MSYGNYTPPLTVRNPNTPSVPGLNASPNVLDSRSVQYPIPDPFTGRTDPSSFLRITVGGKPVPPPVSVGKKIIPIQQNPGGVLVGKKPVPPPVSIGKKIIPIQQNPGGVLVGKKPIPPLKNKNPKIVSCPQEEGAAGAPISPPSRIEENPLQAVSDEEIYTEERLKALLESLNETEEYDVNPKEEINTSEKETDPHRIHQREKQLHMGFITPGYLNFCFGNKVTEALKTFLRTKDDMIAEEYFAPPKPDHIYPKRKFDLALSQWRKKLHLCDGPMLPYEIRIGHPDYKKIKMLTEKSIEFLNETTPSKFPVDFEEYILYLNQGREKNRQKTGPLWRLIHPANV